jgi:dTDP-4-dehydrorhamnose reductase
LTVRVIWIHHVGTVVWPAFLVPPQKEIDESQVSLTPSC